ncbi:hypothetical protein MHM582_2583 [Microbacterium sp. HM58-2]|nr:hypothetical protein MHM582_2583 [Microbacterium sp. HM58-2]
MFRLLWIAAGGIRRFSRRFMPTNILLDRIRARNGLRWGVPAMLLAVPYLMIAHWAGTAVDSGAPEWMNALVLLCIWNAFKMLGIGPASLVLLVDARRRERPRGKTTL